MYVWFCLLCFIGKSSGIARQSPLQGVCVSECNYKRGRTVGVEYLTAERGKHKDRNGASEKGRSGILGVEVVGVIAVRGREGGERERERERDRQREREREREREIYSARR